jgi:serine protease Do
MQTPNQDPRDLVARIRQHRLTATFALLATLSLGILAGSVLTRSVAAKDQAVDSSDARPLSVPSPVFQTNEFARIAKAVGPAVVNINTITLPKQSANRRSGRGGAQRGPLSIQPDPDGGDDSSQGDMQDLFKRFFGGQGGQGGDDDGADSGGGEREALGSGFIVDSRGYIITNNHVVDKADKIYVKLSTDPDDQSEHGRPAHVIGVDPDTDIAVIKIDNPPPNLPTVKLGNSDGAQVGDWVLAIGSPFSLSETVTAGIVSAKNRSIDDNPNGPPNQFQKFIQTDAAINPGNSGGPLVDMAGQVIRGSIGISFQAIPPNSAAGREYGFSNGGVLVGTVTPNGPAAKAGLKYQDAIVAIDGKPIKDGDQLVADISARKVGSTVQLGIVRNGANQTLTVGIADRAKLFANSGNPAADDSAPAEADAGDTKLGIKVDPIPAALASKIGVKGGVIVTSVRPGSFADEINLSKGAVITAINKQPVTDEASYRAIVAGLKPGADVVFEVRGSNSPASAGPAFVWGTLP